MALIKCPECGKDVSDTNKSCIHCGYSLKNLRIENENKPVETFPPLEYSNTPKQPTNKKGIIIVGVIIALIVISLIGFGVKNAENKRIAQYRMDFTSESEMQQLLTSGKWKLMYKGSYIDMYITFTDYSYTQFDESGEFDPSGSNYTLDYKNSTILNSSGSLAYDVIEYRNNIYLRQNPKTDEEKWILFKFTPAY